MRVGINCVVAVADDERADAAVARVPRLHLVAAVVELGFDQVAVSLAGFGQPAIGRLLKERGLLDAEDDRDVGSFVHERIWLAGSKAPRR